MFPSEIKIKILSKRAIYVTVGIKGLVVKIFFKLVEKFCGEVHK